MTSYQHARLVLKPVVEPPPPVTLGLPFGPDGYWKNYGIAQPVGVQNFTGSQDFIDEKLTGGVPNIITRINAARALNHKLILMMTAHSKAVYLDVNGNWDFNLFKAQMDGYNRPDVVAAVAAAVVDGTVIGCSVMDEPQNAGWGDNAGILWMTKAKVDQMCDYVKGIFPTLPCGVAAVHWWKGGIGTHNQQVPLEYYQKLDFLIAEWNWVTQANGPNTGPIGGDINGHCAAVQAFVTRERAGSADHKAPALVYEFNVTNGGIRNLNYPTGGWVCGPDTGGFGTDAPGCMATPAQIQAWGLQFAAQPGCAGLVIWKYTLAMMQQASFQASFAAIAADLAQRPSLLPLVRS